MTGQRLPCQFFFFYLPTMSPSRRRSSWTSQSAQPCRLSPSFTRASAARPLTGRVGGGARRGSTRSKEEGGGWCRHRAQAALPDRCRTGGAVMVAASLRRCVAGMRHLCAATTLSRQRRHAVRGMRRGMRCRRWAGEGCDAKKGVKEKGEKGGRRGVHDGDGPFFAVEASSGKAARR